MRHYYELVVTLYILNSILFVGDSFKWYFGWKSLLFEGYASHHYCMAFTQMLSGHLRRVSSAHIYVTYILNKVPFQLYVRQSDTWTFFRCTFFMIMHVACVPHECISCPGLFILIGSQYKRGILLSVFTYTEINCMEVLGLVRCFDWPWIWWYMFERGDVPAPLLERPLLIRIVTFGFWTGAHDHKL